MTPENLSRSLTMLADHGVAGRGREIKIASRERLRKPAKPDAPIGG